MDISSLYNIGLYPYLSSYSGAYMGTSPYQSLTAAGGLSFSGIIQQAAAARILSAGLNAQPAGEGMVIPQPPDYSGFTYDTSISHKSREEMTLEEYKQWFKNEMSKMPVSQWYQSTCAGGSLVITEKAFKRMKEDPGWEKTVTEMIQKMYSGTGTGQKSWWETRNQARNQKNTEAASAKRTGVTQRRKLSRRYALAEPLRTENKRTGRYFNASL